MFSLTPPWVGLATLIYVPVLRQYGVCKEMENGHKTHKNMYNTPKHVKPQTLKHTPRLPHLHTPDPKPGFILFFTIFFSTFFQLYPHTLDPKYASLCCLLLFLKLYPHTLDSKPGFILGFIFCAAL